jgi:hypothetical protein
VTRYWLTVILKTALVMAAKALSLPMVRGTGWTGRQP